MSKKSQGISAERALVHLLQEQGFAAIRIAGSGNTKTPSADVLAGNAKRQLAIECKTSKTERIYISHEQMNGFLQFSCQFGCEPWIAVKFHRQPWKFLFYEDIPQSKQSYAIHKRISEEKGLFMQELLLLNND